MHPSFGGCRTFNTFRTFNAFRTCTIHFRQDNHVYA